MSNEDKVEITNKKHLSKQWMNGLFHQNNWSGPLVPKKWIPLLWLVASVSAAAPFAASLKEKAIKIPLVSKNQAKDSNLPFEIPEVNSSESMKPKPEKTRSRKVRTMTFVPADVIERTNLDEIPPGSMVKAVLISGASDGPVKAKTTQNLIVAGETLISAGVTFVGLGRSTEERLDLVFRKMVLPSGKTKSIQARAADKSDKIAGLKGSKVGAYASKLAAATGLNFVSGYAEGMKQRDAQNGQIIERATPKNALLNGASFAAVDLSREILSNMKNKAPRIEVPAGTEIYILFEGGM